MSGTIPEEWKLANIVPVHKKGDKEYVENYRPISLLCITSKVLERCVLNNIKFWLHDAVNMCQRGFISGRSCVANLTSGSWIMSGQWRPNRHDLYGYVKGFRQG